MAACKKQFTGYDKQLEAKCVAPYARYADCFGAHMTCVNKAITYDQAKIETDCKSQAEEAAKCQALPAGWQ